MREVRRGRDEVERREIGRRAMAAGGWAKLTADDVAAMRADVQAGRRPRRRRPTPVWGAWRSAS